MDSYDGSKTSCHENEVMLNALQSCMKQCFGAQINPFLIGTGHNCPVPVAKCFIGYRVFSSHSMAGSIMLAWF